MTIAAFTSTLSIAVKKEKTHLQKFLFYFLIFIFGSLLGYYLGFNHSWEKYIQTPYSNQQITTKPSCDALTKIQPNTGEKVTSPLTISVTVDNTKTCKWTVFEAQAGTIVLKDKSGKTLGSGVLKTTDDWMTDQPVTYTGTIKFTTPSSKDLTLTITEEDPSGKGSQTVTIPLYY